MVLHHDRRATEVSTATPIGPEVSGPTGLSSLSLLLLMSDHSLGVDS